VSARDDSPTDPTLTPTATRRLTQRGPVSHQQATVPQQAVPESARTPPARPASDVPAASTLGTPAASAPDFSPAAAATSTPGTPTPSAPKPKARKRARPSATTARTPRRPRNPVPIILVTVLGVLALYYVVVAISGVLHTSSTVPIAGTQQQDSPDYLTLQMRTEDVDLTNRVMQASVLPVPNGALVGSRPGEMSKSLRIEIISAQQTTSVVTFPGRSVVDPTAVSLTLDRGDAAYPFDRPRANFRVSVTDDETGGPVPFSIGVDNSARPWVMQGTVSPSTAENGRTVVPFVLDAHRDTLSIVLVMFYVLAIVLVTLMAVVTTGIALLKKKLEFSNIIWLSAVLLSFPALRSGMPGAPPVGTALDYIVLFPCICLVAGMLIWTGAHLLWRESAALRRQPDPTSTPAVADSPAAPPAGDPSAPADPKRPTDPDTPTDPGSTNIRPRTETMP
jgi:uncharacterized protein DUF4436